MRTLSAAQVRAELGHPVVDGDGHWVEYYPVMTDALRRIGGDLAVAGYAHFGRMVAENVGLTDAERRARNAAHESWWAVPTANALDRATAMMPALLNDRLDEFGIDFTVLYPTQGLGVVGVPDDEMRRAACAAYNTFTADYFADYSHRMPGERGCRRRRTERRRPVPRRPRRSAHRGWLVERRRCRPTVSSVTPMRSDTGRSPSVE